MSELPEYLTTRDADELTFKENDLDQMAARTIEANGTDRNGYFKGDTPANSRLSAGHGHVYITGTVKSGSTVNGRECIISAHSVEENVKLAGGTILFMVSNQADEEHIKAISLTGHVPILVVPAAIRAQVFDVIAPSIRSEMGDLPVRSLKDILTAFPDQSFKLFHYGEEIQMPSAEARRERYL